MINRRKFITTSVLVPTMTASISSLALAQTPDATPIDGLELPVQNASFIRDLSSGVDVAPEPISVLDLKNIRGYILGDPGAPNTLQIYADYRCPHCRVFHAETEPLLIQDFVVNGKMKLEILDFTVIGVQSFLDLDDNSIESVQAAEAAACAAEQDAFVPYRNWLYSGNSVTETSDFSDDNLIAAAGELGLDTDLFSASLADGIYNEAIASTVFLGMARGVRGTPAMTFNGSAPFNMPAEGYEVLRDALEQEINK